MPGAKKFIDINFPQKWVYYLFFTEEVTKSQESNFPNQGHISHKQHIQILTQAYLPWFLCSGVEPYSLILKFLTREGHRNQLGTFFKKEIDRTLPPQTNLIQIEEDLSKCLAPPRWAVLGRC